MATQQYISLPAPPFLIFLLFPHQLSHYFHRRRHWNKLSIRHVQMKEKNCNQELRFLTFIPQEGMREEGLSPWKVLPLIKELNKKARLTKNERWEESMRSDHPEMFACVCGCVRRCRRWLKVRETLRQSH